jgi:hypothetical protein
MLSETAFPKMRFKLTTQINCDSHREMAVEFDVD